MVNFLCCLKFFYKDIKLLKEEKIMYRLLKKIIQILQYQMNLQKNQLEEIDSHWL